VTSPVNARLVLRSSGVSVILDLADGHLPAIIYWGADPGVIGEHDVHDLVRSGVAPVGANAPDEPIRLALLPEHWTGWTGRPGLSGSRAGQDWSTKFTCTSLQVDGEPIEAAAAQSLVVMTSGPAKVVVDARDEEAELALTLRIEVAPSGLLRAQAQLTNLGEGSYQVDNLNLALPVPSTAAEILDFGGRWGKERTPQRQPLHTGIHLREGRKGRTGADAAMVLHLGQPGFGFARGEVWGVHTGWSGNHIHYAERLFSGEQVIGGGELLLPGEIRLGQESRTPRRGSTDRTG